MVRVSCNLLLLPISLQDIGVLRKDVWDDHERQIPTIIQAHLHITGLGEHVLDTMVYHLNAFSIASGYLKWLEQFQVNMHQALLSFLEKHPGDNTAMPAFEIHFQEVLAARAHPLATDNLPLFIGMATTVALTSMSLEVAHELRHAPPSGMSLFEKIFCPGRSKHALDSLRSRLRVVGNVDFSFASACKTFQWYHSLTDSCSQQSRKKI
jgi:hypothetical protein